jgi:hypothetical protein
MFGASLIAQAVRANVWMSVRVRTDAQPDRHAANISLNLHLPGGQP